MMKIIWGATLFMLVGLFAIMIKRIIKHESDGYDIIIGMLFGALLTSFYVSISQVL